MVWQTLRFKLTIMKYANATPTTFPKHLVVLRAGGGGG